MKSIDALYCSILSVLLGGVLLEVHIKTLGVIVLMLGVAGLIAGLILWIAEGFRGG